MQVKLHLHGESNEFGLVEILGQVARLYGIDCAHADEEKIKAQRSQDAARRRVANDEDPVARRERLVGVRRLHNQHGNDQHHFDGNHRHRDQYLILEIQLSFEFGGLYGVVKLPER